MYSLLKGLNKDRYEPLVVMPFQGPLGDRLSMLGIRTIICTNLMIWMPFKGEKVFSHIRRYYSSLLNRILLISQIIEEEEIDLVFSNELLLLEGGLAAKLKRRPHIYHAHNTISNTYFNIYFPSNFIKWVTLSLTDKLLLVSGKQLQEMFKLKPHLNETQKIKVVNQGFDAQYFADESRPANNWQFTSGISNGSSLVVLIAAFVELKGHDDFLRAAYIVSQSLPDTIFVMIGRIDEGYIKNLKDLVFDLKLTNKVFFVDFIEDLASVYRSLDVLVCASQKETFGRTVVEAMLAGKPVVSTRCGGPEETIVNGETGFLVPLSSPRAMADAILKLLRDKELAERMGQEGKKRATQLYSMQSYAKKVEMLIDECIDQKA